MGGRQSVLIRSAMHTGALASTSVAGARPSAATAARAPTFTHIVPRSNSCRPARLSTVSVARPPSGAAPGRRVEVLSKGLQPCRASASTSNATAPEAALRTIEAGLGRRLSDEPQAPPKQPIVIVISGPSGVGKDALLRELQKQRPELYFVVTATTRAKREGEVHGVDYFFVSRPEWEQLMTNGELLEHALVYGEYKGIPKAQVREALARGTDVVLRLDVQGAATVKRLLPSAVFVFLTAESEKALVERLLARKTEAPETLVVRAATAREEAARLGEFDYVVVNAQGQLDRAVRDLGSIIDAEKLRVGRQAPAL